MSNSYFLLNEGNGTRKTFRKENKQLKEKAPKVQILSYINKKIMILQEKDKKDEINCHKFH